MLSFFSCTKDEVVQNDSPTVAPLFTDQPPPPPPAEYGCGCGYIITDFSFVNNSGIDVLQVELNGEVPPTTSPDCPLSGCEIFSGRFFEQPCQQPATNCTENWAVIPDPYNIHWFNCNQQRNSTFKIDFNARMVGENCIDESGILDVASISFRITCFDLGEEFSCSEGQGLGWLSDEITISFAPPQDFGSTIIELVGECGCTPQEM